ncbi:putative glutamine-dependent NAD(+) synthetase [Tepiditoga spiralis]|uniref:Glutamine-dependent NAD(+) synthetase n=1 Tax=Tepiditoga spiralis TaxID=2108365 RepID=A0A7G1G5L7_9BACT|nr:NAD+ synthase [Tepiditoga spiralis]BBE31878.1 putative glutamine-dependent NAD(+) synthetase [Tepiditoga spiralis]
MRVRIAISQINQIVGNYEENYKKIITSIEEAHNNKSDIIIFPELTLNGYPPEDLILKTQYLKKSKLYINKIIEYSKNKNILIAFGAVDWDVETYNSAFIVYNGQLISKYKKMFLPNYSVFDEKRYFIAGNTPTMIEFNDIKIGITICEDIWVPNGPALALAQNGANIILNLSASPFFKGKQSSKLEMLKTRASELSCWIAYCNLIGGQDEVVFDGGSAILNPYGEIMQQAPLFEETILYYDVDPYETTRANLREGKRKHYNNSVYNNIKIKSINHEVCKKEKLDQKNENLPDIYTQMYMAIKCGIKDYVKKNGFSKVVLGLSGGMDSAIVASIAVDALGKDNVFGIMMPSQYSSEGSIDDSKALAENLGIKTTIVPIKDIFDSFMEKLNKDFEGTEFNTTEENIQARIRGVINMAFSNKFGYMVLATGNKSESAVGYSTLYGDMAGGFSPIKDLYKTEVYKVAEKYNELHKSEIIPKNIFTKAPSAELRPDQKDQDSLPDYDTLDAILFRYIDREMSFDEIVEDNYDKNLVKFVIRLVDLNEYKRRQAAPGIKLTERSFGKDRRMPITNGYKVWKEGV